MMTLIRRPGRPLLLYRSAHKVIVRFHQPVRMNDGCGATVFWFAGAMGPLLRMLHDGHAFSLA